MAKRQRDWARKTRDWLHQELGRKCKHCNSTSELELDVIIPIDITHHKKEWSWRMSFYRQQFFSNNLQLLCSKCNSKKGDQLELNSNLIDHPF